MGGSTACKGDITFAGKFLSPCTCSMKLIDSLSWNAVMSHCDTFKCYVNSFLVEHAFNNPLMHCGC